MRQTVLHKMLAPVKSLPGWISNPVRCMATAFLTPIRFSHRSGHFRSSFKMMAVTRKGEPLPWYTYPSIDFLKHRSFEGKRILEFGSGQSTLWWAARAAQVVTLEGDREWYDKVKGMVPGNVDLNHVTMESRSANVADVERLLASKPHATYDVIVIDGLYRKNMVAIARRLMAEGGMIIFDNAESYPVHEEFLDSGLNRVDFCGYAPGVVLPHVTSIYFGASCFVFDVAYRIAEMPSD